MDFVARVRETTGKICSLAGIPGNGATRVGGLTIEGVPPVLPSAYEVDLAAVVAIGSAACAAARLWSVRAGATARTHVDVRHAAAAYRSERYLRVDGGRPPEPWSSVSGFYTAADGWVQLHANFTHHLEAACRALDARPERADFERATATRRAADVEEAVVAEGGCAAMYRSPAEWRAHPQYSAIAALPVLEVLRIGDAPATPLPPFARKDATRPLDGVRVLDLTRVIAGPVCGRTLASYGAHVLRVGASHLPTIPALVLDTGFGKRFAHLDLRHPPQADALRGLAREADIFVQAYRPGALAIRGWAPSDIAALRPGIVYVTLSAWGHLGPWAERRGYDSLVQTASGIAHTEAAAFASEQPRHLPAAALDYTTGYLAAFGAMAALERRAVEGGSWLVRVSLAQTGQWLDTLGRTAPAARLVAAPRRSDVGDLLAEMDSVHGRLTYVRPAGEIVESPPRYDMPPPVPGADPARWW